MRTQNGLLDDYQTFILKMNWAVVKRPKKHAHEPPAIFLDKATTEYKRKTKEQVAFSLDEDF